MVCATFDFGGDGGNPVLKGLPDLVAVPLDAIAGADSAIGLLFDEAFSRLPGRDVELIGWLTISSCCCCVTPSRATLSARLSWRVTATRDWPGP
jgi:hypothetical protein